MIKTGYEAYLPLKKTLRHWSDRKKYVEMPLFSGYVFARLTRDQLNDAVKVNGVARYIFFNGKPSYIRDCEFDLIKGLLDTDIEIEVIDGIIDAGSPVSISSGLLKGYEGIVKKSGKSDKVLVEITGINKTLLVSIDKRDISILNN